MHFMFSWQEFCSCHSNINFISSRHRVISSLSPLIFFFSSIPQKSPTVDLLRLNILRDTKRYVEHPYHLYVGVLSQGFVLQEVNVRSHERSVRFHDKSCKQIFRQNRSTEVRWLRFSHWFAFFSKLKEFETTFFNACVTRYDCCFVF